MDLPPRFRRHLRYGDVLHPPHFINHHLPPLPPSPPPPALAPHPPRPLAQHILLPPLLPPRHDAPLTLPSHYPFSRSDRPIPERSYFLELDPPIIPYVGRHHPPPIPLPHERDLPFPIMRDYPQQNSILEDEIFRRVCSSSSVYDFPQTWDRRLPPWGAAEVISRFPDIEHRDRCGSSRVSGIEVRASMQDKNDDTGRWDYGITGNREWCFERNNDARWESGIGEGRELYFDRHEDVGGLSYGISDGIPLQLENRRQEFLKSNLGLGRFCGRLGRKSGKRKCFRHKKMKRVQKRGVLHRIQSGKACSKRIRGQNILKDLGTNSLRGKEKENFVSLETKPKNNQEREQSPVALSISFKSNSLVAKAISTRSPSSQVSKEDICLPTSNKKTRKSNCTADTGLANSPKDLALTGHMPGFRSGLHGSQIEVNGKSNVSGNGNVTVLKAINLGNNSVENDASKEMHPKGLNNVGSGRRLGRRSKKKKKSRKNILHGTRLQSSKDGVEANFESSTAGTSESLQFNTNCTNSKLDVSCAFVDVLREADSLPSFGSTGSKKVGVSSDTKRAPLSGQKRKSLDTLSASVDLYDDVSTEYHFHVTRVVKTARDADYASTLGSDVAKVHAVGSCRANEDMDHGDSLVFNQQADYVDLHAQNCVSVSNLEKNLVDSKGLLTNLGAVRVESMNEQPTQDGLVLSENAFDEGPFRCPISADVEDISGLSRYHETKIPKVQEDKHLEQHKSNTSSAYENSLFKEVDVIVSDMRSVDVNSKAFVPDQVIVPEIGGYCSSNTKETKSLDGAVADCSNLSFDHATMSSFLSADHKSIGAAVDVFLLNTSKQSYKYNDEANLSNKSSYIEGTFESRNQVKTSLCIDYLSKIKRKRKARGIQVGLSGSNGMDPIYNGSLIDGEHTNVLATDVSSDNDAEDNCEVNSRLKAGKSGAEEPLLDGVDFFGDGSFPGNQKKKKVASPRLNFSPCSADCSIENYLASDDLKLYQVSLGLAEQDGDRREETPSALHVASTDRNGSFSVPDIDGTLAYGSNNLHLKVEMAIDGRDDYAIQSGDELVASGSDSPFCMSSPEDLLSHTDFHIPSHTSESSGHSESELIFAGFQTSNIRPMPRYSRIFSLGKSIENATSEHLRATTKVPPSLPPRTGKMPMPSSKNQLTSAVPKNFSSHPASNFQTSRKFPSTHFAKSRTWHRTDNSNNVSVPTLQSCSLPQSHAPKMPKNFQSSYIRKGNSLVRKPSSSSVSQADTLGSSVYQSNPGKDNRKKNQVKVDAPCILRKGPVNTSEGLESLPPNHNGKPLKGASCHSAESLPATNFLTSGGPTKKLDVLNMTVKPFEIPERRTGSGNNSESQITLGGGNLGKKLSYVKRRSNQLIATCDPEDSSEPAPDKSRASLSDGYYKNSKNQLIRVSSESQGRKGDLTATLNSQRLGSQRVLRGSSGKRQSSKGFAKTNELSKSLVWKLNGSQLPDKSSNSLRSHKGRPYLFPWKRATYRRSSLSTISQKLLLSSKRGAIYRRSTHGYSLRISKVLSVGGRSLKWSKSIERNSKKANEEATRAVAAAAVEKRKKEEKGAISILSQSKNHVSRKSVVSVKLRPGERVFRIGSERYKMDPSRRSLHRITAEEEPSPSGVIQSEKNKLRSYVPKRLLIGYDEYVRIGTGNQLVRDPKKRIRLLASEKVRWSLRTARLRLARKRKYCQFYTRFGKCNKSDGKCPYVHDPSKVVVCTKFLNGTCTDSDCKLTHKVIPERMQDCSYFLKGSCSNENCPYRHVDVNPNSSICKRFLRGYCADGNECRKKHTYVCPAFESTGVCPQEGTCKLHHPRKKREKKPICEQKIVRGRYFDGGLIDAAECGMATNEQLSAGGEGDIICEEGKLPDYISLDVIDDCSTGA